MPLRDHFRPPVSLQATWDALHGMWPAEIVRQLRERLPQGYVAAPTVHPGSQVEVVPDFDEYSVRIYDAERGRRLVATIELVSPGNKEIGRRSAMHSSGNARPCSRRASPSASSIWSRHGNSISMPSCCSSWDRVTRAWPNRCRISTPCRAGGDHRTSGCCCKPGRTRSPWGNRSPRCRCG
jgi:hypothetical protein